MWAIQQGVNVQLSLSGPATDREERERGGGGRESDGTANQDLNA